MSKYHYRKAVRICGDNVYLGKLYDDNSYGDLIRLYTDSSNTFQLEFMRGTDLAYTFLPECDELLEILKQGIVGTEVQTIGYVLVNKGYILVK